MGQLMRILPVLFFSPVLFLGVCFFGPCLIGTAAAAAVPVEVVEKDGRYQLMRGGEPYHVRGAGFEYADISEFAAHGGNSFRTWTTNDEQLAVQLLDEAARNDVTVALCIEIGRERLGFDYNDETAVAAQLEFARGEVMKYKDHPALLAWVIGNEPNMSFKNPAVFNAINDISKMIHAVDGNHPTTTALAGFNAELAGLVESRAPDLDFVSTQLYGGLVNLPRIIREINFKRPFMVTEWGAIGHWEVNKTAWGAPLEQNSSEKAANYLKSHQLVIAAYPHQAIGSYVFLWGQKQERTPTWYGMFLADGSKTEAIDVMHKLWTGDWPDNRAPLIDEMQFDSKNASHDVVIAAGQRYRASVTAQDPDGDMLRYRWEIMTESMATQEGGDKEQVPEIVGGLIGATDQAGVVVEAPEKPGAYRLFVYVYDDNGSAGHANIPFLVE